MLTYFVLEGRWRATKAKALPDHKVTAEPAAFVRVYTVENPVVVFSRPGQLGFNPTRQYLARSKGFPFHALSKVPVSSRGWSMNIVIGIHI